MKKPKGEACVGCQHAGGIVLHYCTNQKSELSGELVKWGEWCEHFARRDETASHSSATYSRQGVNDADR